MMANQPFSLRLSEEAVKSIEAEARITGKSQSEVVRNRVQKHVEDQESEQTNDQLYDQLISRDMRMAMVRAVDMANNVLLSHIDWMRSHLSTIKQPQRREEFEQEMAVFVTERNLRGDATSMMQTVIIKADGLCLLNSPKTQNILRC